MVGEIIVYAIIPKKGKNITVTNFDNSNEIKDCNEILYIGPTPITNCKFISSNNIIISNQITSNTFIDRLKFRYKYLFKYN